MRSETGGRSERGRDERRGEESVGTTAIAMALSLATSGLVSAVGTANSAKFATHCGAIRSGASVGVANFLFHGDSAVSATSSAPDSFRDGPGIDVRNSASNFRRRVDRARGLFPLRKLTGSLVIRAEGEAVKSEQLAYDGPGKGGQWLSSTTRHVRIFVGVADPDTKAMDQSQLDKLTLMLDPDNEFVWPDDKVQKVYDYFAELVENYAGAPCTEYTLRLIGSDIEHFIRKLLLANEIKYNLECGVLNFSMGKPRYDPATLEGVDNDE